VAIPAANPATAIETSAHRRTRSNDIDPIRAHAAFAAVRRCSPLFAAVRRCSPKMRPPRLSEINSSSEIVYYYSILDSGMALAVNSKTIQEHSFD
jgi:hypothetical protein